MSTLPAPTRLRQRLLLSLCCLVLCVLPAGAFSQTITMTIPNITGAGGETIQALEYSIDVPVAIGVGGSGQTSGKAVGSPLSVKKNADSSFVFLFARAIAGTVTPSIVIEYKKPDINDGKPFFIITLTDVLISKCRLLSPECPGCSKTEVELAFSPRTIRVDDKLAKVVRTWNIETNVVN